VFTGTGTAGAYHAGVLRAFDESGFKFDLVVGSGMGTVTAAFAAAAGGTALYGKGGVWDGARWRTFYRLRPSLRAALLLLSVAFGVFAVPVLMGLLLGILFPLLLLADRIFAGTASRVLSLLWVAPEVLSGPYLAAQAVPMLGLALVATFVVVTVYLRRRSRIAEAFESVLDAEPGLARLKRALWEVARGAVLTQAPPSEAELSRRYVDLVSESFGDPGYRELILRVADLEHGRALAFTLLSEQAAPGERDHVVDLRVPEQGALFFDALATGLLLPMALPLRRVAFPRGAVHAGEVHRLTDASLVPGCGIEEAIEAGAEQIVVVTGAPEEPQPPPRRRGPLARVDATLRALEQQAAAEIEATERTNRMVSTLGHRTSTGRGAWEDPATGRVYREVDLWVIRPRRRTLGPTELDGASEPATEVLQTTDDLVERGFRDAYRQFIEPVVGHAPLPEREEGKYRDSQAVGL
jgi:hypothetical protein